MAVIRMSPLQFFDGYVKPVAEGLGLPGVTAYGIFRAAIALIPGAAVESSITIPDIPAPPSLGDLIPTPSPAPALTPITPTDALREVARAVRDAEAILNESNLAIADASAEVTLLVSVGGLAGAEATISVKVSPTSEPIPKKQS